MVGLWAFDEFFLQYPDPRHFLLVRATGHNQAIITALIGTDGGL
jgi:hypothetical protein